MSSPEDVQKILAHAREHLDCPDCLAAPGESCTRPGAGRSLCKSRYVHAAIELSRQAKAARRTREQAAVLASLPKVSAAEIDAARSPRGGWTRATLARWNVPWPPPPGWRQALLRGEDGADER